MIDRRPHVGWEVRCDAKGCRATTAYLAPPQFRKSAEQAVEAARQLQWLPVRIDGRTHHVCPLQQLYDPRLERWVAIPLAVQP